MNSFKLIQSSFEDNRNIMTAT
jgi:hypothetical protein